MTEVKFGTPQPIPFRLADCGNIDIMLRARGTISADTDDPKLNKIISAEALKQLNRYLTDHSGKLNYAMLTKLYPEPEKFLSSELTDKMGFTCTAKIEEISPTEDSKKVVTQKLNEILQSTTICIDENYKGDCVPPAGIKFGSALPVGMDDALRSKETAEEADRRKSGFPDYDAMWDKIRESIPPIPQPVHGIMADSRPKFCRKCGSPLPQTGNFCGECGQPIM